MAGPSPKGQVHAGHMIFLDRDVGAEAPVRLYLAGQGENGRRRAEKRLDDGEALAEEFLERLVVPRRLKAAEDQRAAGRDLHRRQRGPHVLRRLAEQRLRLRDADRTPFLVVAPMMKAADDRAAALL